MTCILFSRWMTDHPDFREALRPLIRSDARVLMLPFAYARDCDRATFERRYGHGGRHHASAVEALATWGIPTEAVRVAPAFADEHFDREAVMAAIGSADILLLPGGMPDMAVERLERLGLADAVRAHGGIVMGYSAGALIQPKDYFISPDEDYPSLLFAHGLGLCDPPFFVEVHDTPSAENDARLRAIADSTGRLVCAMSDAGAILLCDGQEPRFIGEVRIFRPTAAQETRDTAVPPTEDRPIAEPTSVAGHHAKRERSTQRQGHTEPSRQAAVDRRRAFLRGERAVSPSATVLVAVIYTLLLLSRLIDTAFLNRESRYLSVILLQLLIFSIPAYLYIRLKPRGYVRALRLNRFRLSYLFLLLAGILMLVSGCTLLGMLCGMMHAQPSFTLYDTFSSVNDGTVGASVRLMLAYGLLPAFCEELVFRGILCAEHERHGILYASTVSALFFAFLHFDLTAFPVYLFAGLLLSFVLYVTRSAIAAMVVHLGYNLFGIFVQAGLSGYCRSTGSVGLLVVLLIALLLLSAAFFCGEVARILRRRAKVGLLDNPDDLSTPGLNRLAPREWPRALLCAFASPAGVMAVALWLFGVIVNLVR